MSFDKIYNRLLCKVGIHKWLYYQYTRKPFPYKEKLTTNGEFTTEYLLHAYDSLRLTLEGDLVNRKVCIRCKCAYDKFGNGNKYFRMNVLTDEDKMIIERKIKLNKLI